MTTNVPRFYIINYKHITSLDGLGGITVQPHFIYIYPFPLFIKFSYFSLPLRSPRAHGAHGFSIRFPLYIPLIFKYLPHVSKGGWLPPFHTLSFATYEIYTPGV